MVLSLYHVLRSFGPEAYITLDKNYTYSVGGVEIQNQHHRAYVNLTCLSQGLTTSNSSFQYVSHTVSKPVAPVPWTPGYRHSPKLPWPPVGVHLEVVFQPPACDFTRIEFQVNASLCECMLNTHRLHVLLTPGTPRAVNNCTKSSYPILPA